MIEHADELPGKKLREKVKEHQAQALLSKKLATIFTDVPLSLELDDLALKERDEEKSFRYLRSCRLTRCFPACPRKKDGRMTGI